MSNGNRRGGIALALLVLLFLFICWMTTYYLTHFQPHKTHSISDYTMKSELEMMAYHEDNSISTTSRIKKSIIQALHELGVIDMLNASAESAEKAFRVAQRIETRDMRRAAADYNASKMEIKED